MLSDEEKKAIEYWKGYMKILHWNTQLASEHYIKVLLDLVEKQSKEIEELKDMNERQQYRIELVSEDEIEELKKKPTFLIKDIYSPKLKEISLQDAEGLIEQGREEIKDKIKAKIEEVKDGTFDAKIVLQSLLEKE